MTTQQHDIRLTTEQRTALIDALESALKDLSYEISDTDSHDFREGLKAKRDLLNGIMQQLQAS